MSNLAPATSPETGVSEPASAPTLEAHPGRLTDVGGLPIRRLLPRTARRLVGPWCFLDSYGPLSFHAGKAMDVAPHPHIGLQTVSWLLDGEVLHNDSLGRTGTASPGVLNLMTAGRGIAHAEETPRAHTGRLRGIQAWLALPERSRETTPDFQQHRELPSVALDGGRATVIMGALGDARSPAKAFSPVIGAEIRGDADRRVVIPLEPAFEHALVLLSGACRLGESELAVDTLYYLGSGRRELLFSSRGGPCHLLLLGGAPFGETILMWWNFVARTNDELASARDDWQTGRRFGDVEAYAGRRLAAPQFVPRTSSRS